MLHGASACLRRNDAVVVSQQYGEVGHIEAAQEVHAVLVHIPTANFVSGIDQKLVHHVKVRACGFRKLFHHKAIAGHYPQATVKHVIIEHFIAGNAIPDAGIVADAGAKAAFSGDGRVVLNLPPGAVLTSLKPVGERCGCGHPCVASGEVESLVGTITQAVARHKKASGYEVKIVPQVELITQLVGGNVPKPSLTFVHGLAVGLQRKNQQGDAQPPFHGLQRNNGCGKQSVGWDTETLPDCNELTSTGRRPTHVLDSSLKKSI